MDALYATSDERAFAYAGLVGSVAGYLNSQQLGECLDNYVTHSLKSGAPIVGIRAAASLLAHHVPVTVLADIAHRLDMEVTELARV